MKKAASLCIVIIFILAACPAAALAAEELPAAFSEKMVYATEPVLMRIGPGIEYESVAELQTAEAVVYQGMVGKWAQVRRDGVRGYVFAQYLTNPAHDFGSAYVAKSNISVYAGDDTKSKQLGKIKKGALVMQYNSVGDWACVYWEDGFGYVRSKYLKPVSKAGRHYNTWSDSRALLEKAGYFTQKHTDVLIDYYVDANQNLAMRVSSNADRAKLEKEIAEILGKDTPFSITVSSLPGEYNTAKIAKIIKEIGDKNEKLAASQKAELSLSMWGYSPVEDCFHVGMVDCNEKTIALFKKWIGNIPNVEYQTAVIDVVCAKD